jgi:hypothetical protein
MTADWEVHQLHASTTQLLRTKAGQKAELISQLALLCTCPNSTS